MDDASRVETDDTVCPFCDAHDSELISLFGSQLLTSQYRCRACASYFEGLREDRDATLRPAPMAPDLP